MPTKPQFKQLTLVGFGMMGASVAAAAKQSGMAGRLAAYDTDPQALATGQRLGLLDEAASSIAAATDTADLIVLALPVGAYAQAFAQINPEGKLLTDVGSVKLSAIEAASQAYGNPPANFVPGHPIAGSEQHGAAAGSASLFTGQRVILTPLDATDPKALGQVSRFWQGLGARIATMPPSHHDELLARTSHLPHLLAYALMDALTDQGKDLDIFEYAAGGLRDLSRIAASDPVMWRDIMQANEPQVLAALDEYERVLHRFRELIVRGDFDELKAVFARAKQARDHFTQLEASKRPKEN